MLEFKTLGNAEVTLSGIMIVTGNYFDLLGVEAAMGGASVFKVKNTHLKSFGHKERRLVREIQERYGDDLDRFRSDTRLRPRREN